MDDDLKQEPNSNHDEPFSLEQLENSGSKILDRIAEKLKQSSDTTSHASHSSHGSGSHTSSN
jgi:hypothetical protein